MSDTSETQDLREQLIEIIAKEGMIEREKLTPDATIEKIGMASYDMVMVLMALEEKFGVYISVDSELTDVKTLDELLTVLSRRIEEQKNAPPGEAAPPPAEGVTPKTPDDAAKAEAAAAAAAAAVSTASLTAAMEAEADAEDDGESGSTSKSETEA